MNIDVLSVGVATPPHQYTQEASLALAHRICCADERRRRFAKVLYEHSGVRTRHGVLPLEEADRWAPEGACGSDSVANRGPSTAVRMDYYRQHAPPLAVSAARHALLESGCSPAEITHVVTASCTGFTAPGIDLALIEELELAPITQRVHVGYMGCHGAINALRAAHGLACADSRNRILICAVELCTIHYAFEWSPERMLGNALFADGAGAVVLGGAAASSEGEQQTWRLAATGSYIFPGTSGAMSWNIGDFGFEMSLSSELPKLIEANLGPWLRKWLEQQGIAVADVKSWAVHPGGPRIVEAVESAMGLTREQTAVSREILARYGNMSSATVLFILRSLMVVGAEPPCVMLGFGPGLVAEVALLI